MKIGGRRLHHQRRPGKLSCNHASIDRLETATAQIHQANEVKPILAPRPVEQSVGPLSFVLSLLTRSCSARFFLCSFCGVAKKGGRVREIQSKQSTKCLLVITLTVLFWVCRRCVFSSSAFLRVPLQARASISATFFSSIAL